MNAKLLLGATLLFASAALPAAAGAQRTASLPVGSTVRVASPGYTGIATLIATPGDSLQIVVEGLAARVSLPTESVMRLERRRPANAMERVARGAMWGGGMMAVLGLVTVASVGMEEGSSTENAELSDAGMLMYPVMGGAMWGGVIGLIVPQHRWEPVRLPVRVGVSPASGAVSVGAGLAF